MCFCGVLMFSKINYNGHYLETLEQIQGASQKQNTEVVKCGFHSSQEQQHCWKFSRGEQGDELEKKIDPI